MSRRSTAEPTNPEAPVMNVFMVFFRSSPNG
jgi:hypothetical protein